MGWCIANMCSDSGCSRVKGNSYYMEFYINSENENGNEEIKKFCNYLNGQDKQFSKFIKNDDDLGDEIKVCFRNKKGRVENLYQGINIPESEYQGIYEKVKVED